MGTTSPSAVPRGAFDIGSETAIGGRPANQDRSDYGDGWVVLSDGMGGYAGGGRAAELAVAAATEVLRDGALEPAAAVVEAIRRANVAVRRGQQEDPALAEMGATITVAVAVAAGDRWLVANLGDSPAWVVREGETELVAEIQNVAGEMVRQGVLDPREADHHPGSHVLLRAVGLDDEPEPSVRSVTLASGERLVVASDGLGGGLDTRELHLLLGPSGTGSAAEDAELLVTTAVAGGATDNVTAVVVRA